MWREGKNHTVVYGHRIFTQKFQMRFECTSDSAHARGVHAMLFTHEPVILD